MKKQNLFVRVLSAIWTGVDGFRKVIHLFLMLFVFAVIISAMSGNAPILPQKAALVVQPTGALVEELEGDPYDRAIEELLGEARPQTLVQDLVDALEYARDDDRIEAIHLELGGLSGAGLTKLHRIGAALDDFRTSGKPVIASADFLTQPGYYLAAHADELYLHPEGALLLRGFGRFRTYFKDAIDNLRLDWNIFRVGTHKTFVEPYERMDMSDADRESSGHLIDQLWTSYREEVAAARGIDVAVIDDYANNYVAHAGAARGDLATIALDKHLVDKLLTHTQIRDLMIEYVGPDSESADTYAAIDLSDYLAQMRLLQGDRTAEQNVAVIIASGEIMFGRQPPGIIGAESTSALLRMARNDESVKAVVLRVDSPGGSVFASAVIGNEIEALRASGKPVVASMSSSAASGGYWISVGADRILASPSTITGSIGIFGMFPTYQRTAALLGIATDGFGSTPLAGELRPDREMAPQTRELFQLVVEDGYDDFISRVASLRGLDKAAVDAVAQGRVWTGTDALQHGLVDELGTLEDAIAAAAELANLEDGEYGRKTIRNELSPTEQMIVDMLGTARSLGIDITGLAGRSGAIDRIAARVESVLAPLTSFNDPKGLYAHCLCTFD